MKKARIIALISLFVITILLISGCVKQQYEKLSFGWTDKDIKVITLYKMQYSYAITEQEEITKLLNYLKKANVVSKEEIGITGGWTYAIKVTLENDEYYWIKLNESVVRWDIDRESQIICTVETDYFKPLIEIMDSDLLKVY